MNIIKPLESFAVNRRTSLQMSKNGRTQQSEAAQLNWQATARMLFLADIDPGRTAELKKLTSEALPSSIEKVPSYNSDQFQYVLVLMLIISIVEKRTEELYSREFADRCDAISKQYRLNDDEFWQESNVPPEWKLLTLEFQKKSMGIVADALREYGQEKIAEKITIEGADQLFAIMESVRLQFFNLLENSMGRRERDNDQSHSSIPETLQPWTSSKEDE